MIKAFAKVQTPDRLTNQLQSNIGASITALNANPLNAGILLSDVALVTGSNNVYTTLPGTLVGWLVIDADAASSIYREESSDPGILILNASADVTVSLFVF